MRTMVVDDQAETRMFLQLIFEQAGHQVDLAENGRDAVLMYLRAVEQHRPYNFISIDYEMPIMNGCKAIEMIRAHETEHGRAGARAVICLISGSDQCRIDYEAKFGNDYQTRFLCKPLDLGHLMDIVQATATERSIVQLRNNALRRAA